MRHFNFDAMSRQTSQIWHKYIEISETNVLKYANVQEQFMRIDMLMDQ